ncbi:MAG TPA: hypothetical protein VNU70_12970, partial [Puia sp.]|nr:hypothetical protein [Puia sp.]
LKDDPSFAANGNFRRDMFNILLGIIAQLCLTLLPMYLVLGQRLPLFLNTALLAVIILILKKTWWDRLNDY